MSYFQKHASKNNNHQPENIRPCNAPKVKKAIFHSRTEQNEPRHHKLSSFNEVHIFNPQKPKEVVPPKAQRQIVKAMPQRDLSGFMLEGQNSMEQLLNSSINQFTKYLSDRDPLEEQHQQLVAQNYNLKKTLDKLKIIIKQKLVSALSKQRQQLNAVMEDYVQLITKLLADKQELTATIEQLESKLAENQQKNQLLAQAQQQAQKKAEDLSKDREEHIAKTKQQIDDFLQIIQQYEEEADQEAKEGDQLKQRIKDLEEQLTKAKQQSGKGSLPQKTKDLLQLLQKAEEQNKMLRHQFSSEKREIERQNQEEFIEYEKAMQQTISKKDECIAHLKMIIENLKMQRGKDSTFIRALDLDLSRQ